MKPVVLVTAIGTVTASSILTELKKDDHYYLIGADINHKYEIASSLEVNEFYSFPMVDNSGYLEFVLEFCRKHRVSYYFAVLDKEVMLITKYKKMFDNIGVTLCMVDYSFANRCHYKDVFAKWINANFPEIAIKTYSNITEIDESVFPLFLKPVEGVASAGCKKIGTLEELELMNATMTIGSDYILQEYVSGEIVTVDLIRNRRTGQKAQIQRRELLRNANGCGIAVEIINDRKLTQVCEDLMDKLDLDGVCNAEFFRILDQYRIIEVNPRLSAGTRFSCMAGLNTIRNAMLIAEGRDCEFGNILYGKHYAERYIAYQMD